MSLTAVLAACADSDPEVAAPSTPLVDATSAGTSQAYMVVAGDFLSGIADDHCVGLSELVEHNGWPEGADHPIFPGDEVRIPRGACAPTVEVEDTAETEAPAAALEPGTSGAGKPAHTQAAHLHFGDPSMLYDEDSFESRECVVAWDMHWQLVSGFPVRADGSPLAVADYLAAIDALPGEVPQDTRAELASWAEFAVTYGPVNNEMLRKQAVNGVDITTTEEYARIEAAAAEVERAGGMRSNYLREVCPQIRFPDS